MLKSLVNGLLQFDLQLSDRIIQKEITYLDELLRWNQRINLTSIKNREEALEKHLIDSLLLLPHLDEVVTLLDLGSGGGLPGIPLAIASSSLQIVSIDSVGKKINFQRHIKRFLSLENLQIIQARAERLDRTALEAESFDLVVARAFTSLEPLLEYAEPWLKPGGRVIAMKGPGGGNELSSAEPMIEQNRFADPLLFSYELPFSQAERQLLILKKTTS
ncbi:MAG: 16S rRNA (guanine(527)-N(7))-methyltransferase RsmG [Desulfobacterales bacterium]|nr:16S rRNA (guanine(527)-N(7))-methyltransferase RsmG [Desulfobacterales bacterium]